MAAYFIYMFVRKVIIPNVEPGALDNAVRIISFERNAGFFWEPNLQEWALGVGEWLPALFNWVYIITYWPIILTTALIYYLLDRNRYFYYRSVILLSFVVALIIFAAFPLAPPRMLPEHGFVDTIAAFGPTWYGSREMATYYNAFAAMPSLHFAWTVAYAFLFWHTGPRWLKVLGVLYPISTFFAITITANHYIMDAVVGAAMMLVTYLAYEFLFNRGIIFRVRIPGVGRPHAHLPLPSWRRGGNGRIGTHSSETST